MVDRWLGTLTQKHLILLLMTTWLCIGFGVSVIVLLAGYGWLPALMFGGGCLATLAGVGFIRLVVQVVLKIRRG